MREKIEKLVDLILLHFCVSDPGERNAFLEGVYQHLQDDRERYVALEKEGQRRFYGAPPQEGRICKLLPLAESVETDDGVDDVKSVSFRVLYLMVTQTRVRLVLSQFAVNHYNVLEPAIFFPNYTVVDPFNLPEELVLLSPKQMRERIVPMERLVFPMAMRAICKIYDTPPVHMIPIKAERCMLVMWAYPKGTYKMETGEELEGVLIPVGGTSMDQESHANNEVVMVTQELCILQMEDQACYVMRTKREITRYTDSEPRAFDPNDDDDDDDMDAIFDSVEEQKTYRLIELDDIPQEMSAYY